MIEPWCACFPEILFPDTAGNAPPAGVDALSASPPQTGDKYLVRRVVGSGATGTALIGRRERDGLPIIAKIVDLGEMDETQRTRAESEIQCLSQCRHSAIIQYLTHHLEGSKLLLIMELADAGDLGFQIKHRRENKAYFLEQEVALMLSQILIAVHYIHSQSILHRDLKPANVFVKTNGLVKVGDFGLSKVFEETVSRPVAQSLVGTPYYLAPEVWRREKYGKKADMFSIGVLWYEMLTLDRPFKGGSVAAVMQSITEGKFNPLPSNISADTAKLVVRLLASNPEERPSICEIFECALMDHALRIFSTMIVRGLPLVPAAREHVQNDAITLRKAVQRHLDVKYPVGNRTFEAYCTAIVHLEEGKKWKHRALRTTAEGHLLIGKTVEAAEALTSAAIEAALATATEKDRLSHQVAVSNVRIIPVTAVSYVNEVPRCFAEGRTNIFSVVLNETDESLWFYSALDPQLSVVWTKKLSAAAGRYIQVT